MDIRELQIFLAIARERSVSGAAKHMYMTPQGVSKILKNLESELDCQLFHRSKSGMSLTESGNYFFAYARDSVERSKQMRGELLRIKQRQMQVVDLLSAYGILRLVTPECILAFKREHPEIQLLYREYPDLQVEKLFAEGEGNVAFSIGEFDEKANHVFSLESFEVKMLVNKANPLSSRESVTIEDLKGQPLYIESDQFYIYRLIMERCHAAGFEPKIVFETSGFSLCNKMVRQNKGVSVMVDFIYEDMSSSDVKLIPFSDGTYAWSACMLTRRGEEENEAVSCFQKHVKKWLEKIESGEIQR